MRVLVACEYSGVVRDAFTARGHHAISADLLPTERPGPHHHGDVLDLLALTLDDAAGARVDHWIDMEGILVPKQGVTSAGR